MPIHCDGHIHMFDIYLSPKMEFTMMHQIVAIWEQCTKLVQVL